MPSLWRPSSFLGPTPDSFSTGMSASSASVIGGRAPGAGTSPAVSATPSAALSATTVAHDDVRRSAEADRRFDDRTDLVGADRRDDVIVAHHELHLVAETHPGPLHELAERPGSDIAAGRGCQS